MDSNTQILNYYLTMPKFGTGIGIHRISWLLRKMLNSEWGKDIDAIHVTGSNGKGSTVNFISSLLIELKINTGVFISPHLFEFNERISLNDKYVSNESLINLTKWLNTELIKYEREFPEDKFGGFEAIFGIAIKYFYENKVDTMVLEAGIGGRYDTTNILKGKTNVLTSIDLEHTQLLGGSKELIAFDKADICRQGDTLIIGNLDDELIRRLKAYCILKQINTEFLKDFSKINKISYNNDKMFADFTVDRTRFIDIEYNLLGEYQIENSILAIKAVKHWCKRNNIKLTNDILVKAVNNTFSKIFWRGRFEKILDKPPLFVDVGHTPDGIDKVIKLAENIFKDKYVILITGVSIDKEIHKIVLKLSQLADYIICTKANHKGTEPSEIYNYLKKFFPLSSLEVSEYLKEAIEKSFEISHKHSNSVIFVAGGLFLAAEATAIIQNKINPSELVFF